MDILDIASVYDLYQSPDDIVQFIEEHRDGFILQVPLPSIGSAGEHLSIAEDYLEASYIGENLAKSAKSVVMQERRVRTYYLILDFEIIPSDLELMAKQIWEYAMAFDNEERSDENVRKQHYSAVERYESTLDNRTEFVFPELVDDYYANLIEGAYREYEGEFNLNEIYSKFPERRFGYWKSAFGRSSGQHFYASTDGWIVPPETDLQFLLKSYANAPADVIFEPAKLIIIDERAYLISDSYVTHFPFGPFLQSLNCKEVAVKPEEYLEEYDWMHLLYTYNRIREHFKTEYGHVLSYPSENEYFIAEYGELVLIQVEDYKYIYFGTDKLSERQIFELKESLSSISDRIYSFAGLNQNIVCLWEELDDEKFEQLCYDIIYYNPKFDNRTIRKMGKSRSRDSGRDIEIFTAARPGYTPEKYIIQCKYLGSGSSLMGSKLTGISDIMDQHAAQGYGLMTSGIIDSTLYDRLDGISRSRGFKLETWSVLEIERYLSRHPQIKERYFGKS